MPKKVNRVVFMISDGTGITVQSFVRSLLTQFSNLNTSIQRLSYIDTLDKAQVAVQTINQCYQETLVKPLVFITLVDPAISTVIQTASGCFFDLFNVFIKQLEQELGQTASDTIGRAYAVADNQKYDQRIDSINYALTYDDGLKPSGYDHADIILVGVSRCGKTPTCLYMALSFGIFAANYPFAENHLANTSLPQILRAHKNKLFGLTIDPVRLQHIRTERRPNTSYASIEQCRREVYDVEGMYLQENIPFINSTRYSIEEIATKIMSITKTHRRI